MEYIPQGLLVNMILHITSPSITRLMLSRTAAYAFKSRRDRQSTNADNLVYTTADLQWSMECSQDNLVYTTPDLQWSMECSQDNLVYTTPDLQWSMECSQDNLVYTTADLQWSMECSQEKGTSYWLTNIQV